MRYIWRLEGRGWGGGVGERMGEGEGTHRTSVVAACLLSGSVTIFEGFITTVLYFVYQSADYGRWLIDRFITNRSICLSGSRSADLHTVPNIGIGGWIEEPTWLD